MPAAMTIKVYKNEDVNNPEYATIEEVKQAFFGRGVFIKDSSGTYCQVTGFGPNTGYLYADGGPYELARVDNSKPSLQRK